MTIKDAKEQARIASVKSPEDIIYVMKKGRSATYTRIPWIVRERILDGWGPVCEYRNGIEKI